MRKLLALTLAAGVLGGPVLAGPAAHAEDQRPCVSSREFNALRSNTYRSVVEQRWEVEGLGQRVTEMFPRHMTAYPWCGHGSIDEAYVAVQYRNGGKSGWSLSYDCRWSGNTCPE